MHVRNCPPRPAPSRAAPGRKGDSSGGRAPLSPVRLLAFILHWNSSRGVASKKATAGFPYRRPVLTSAKKWFLTGPGTSPMPAAPFARRRRELGLRSRTGERGALPPESPFRTGAARSRPFSLSRRERVGVRVTDIGRHWAPAAVGLVTRPFAYSWGKVAAGPRIPAAEDRLGRRH